MASDSQPVFGNKTLKSKIHDARFLGEEMCRVENDCELENNTSFECQHLKIPFANEWLRNTDRQISSFGI
jgi:hypothetical protein